MYTPTNFIIYSDLYLLIRILLARILYIISFHLQKWVVYMEENLKMNYINVNHLVRLYDDPTIYFKVPLNLCFPNEANEHYFSSSSLPPSPLREH